LLDITQLLQRNAQDLQKTVERTRFLRRSHPHVNVAESIYNRDDCISIYSAGDSVMASSELSFDFDNIVIDSAVYRRVLAAAKRQIDAAERDKPKEGIDEHIGSDTRSQADTVVAPTVLSRQHYRPSVRDRSHLVEPPQNTGSSARSSPPYPLYENDYIKTMGPTCSTCLKALGRSYVTAFERRYHPEHFLCHHCCVVLDAHDTYYEHSKEVFCVGCYLKQHADVCAGCEMPVIEQHVEISNNGVQQSWHSECYTICKSWGFTRQRTLGINRYGGIWTGAEGCELDSVTFKNRHESAMVAISYMSTRLSGLEKKAVLAVKFISKAISDGMHSRGVLSAALLVSIFGMLFTASNTAQDRRPDLSRKGNNPPTFSNQPDR
jgi:hypothetical protein